MTHASHTHDEGKKARRENARKTNLAESHILVLHYYLDCGEVAKSAAGYRPQSKEFTFFLIFNLVKQTSKESYSGKYIRCKMYKLIYN